MVMVIVMVVVMMMVVVMAEAVIGTSRMESSNRQRPQNSRMTRGLTLRQFRSSSLLESGFKPDTQLPTGRRLA